MWRHWVFPRNTEKVTPNAVLSICWLIYPFPYPCIPCTLHYFSAPSSKWSRTFRFTCYCLLKLRVKQSSPPFISATTSIRTFPSLIFHKHTSSKPRWSLQEYSWLATFPVPHHMTSSCACLPRFPAVCKPYPMERLVNDEITLNSN